jgi:hypothetical protein
MRGSSGVSALNWPERKDVVRLPYAGESTIESRNDVSDAGSDASEDPSDAAPALPAAAAASCGVEACSAASAAASADFLTGHAAEPNVLLKRHEHVREVRSGRTHSTLVHERAPVVGTGSRARPSSAPSGSRRGRTRARGERGRAPARAQRWTPSCSHGISAGDVDGRRDTQDGTDVTNTYPR